MAAPITREILERFAKNSKLLSLLDSAGLERLAGHGVLTAFAPDAVVVRQGDLGATFYLIVSGEVRVCVAEAGDKEVARLAAGTFFGEMAVVARQPRSATVQTTVQTNLISFGREPLVEILRDYPKVREFLSSVGLARTEENMSSMLADSDDTGGLAGLLEPDDEDELNALVAEMDDDDNDNDDDDGDGDGDGDEKPGPTGR